MMEQTSEEDELLINSGGSDKAPVQAKRLVIIEPLILLYMMAYTPGLTIGEQYVLSRLRHDRNISDQASINGSECDADTNSSIYILGKEAQQEASYWMLMLNLSGVIPAAVSTLVIGSYSDKAGRKVAMIAPLIGCIARVLVTILVMEFNLPILFLCVGSFLEGLTGGIVTMLMGCFSYTADITTTKTRTFRVILVELCLGLGTAVMQITTGYLIQIIHFAYSNFVFLGISLLGLAYAIFLVPETIERNPKARFISFQHFLDLFKVYGKDNGTNRRWKLQICLAILWPLCMVSFARFDSQTYYALGDPLCWTSIKLGFFNAETFAAQIVVQLIVVKIFERFIGDNGLLLVGAVSGITSQILLAFAVNDVIMFTVPIVGACLSLGVAIVRSVSSKFVQSDEQGVVFSAIACVEAISSITGTIIFNTVFAATVQVFKGFVFLTMAGMLAIHLILDIVMIWGLRREKARIIVASVNPETPQT